VVVKVELLRVTRMVAEQRIGHVTNAGYFKVGASRCAVVVDVNKCVGRMLNRGVF
jgi:uncharacterized pyridoxal phosphate-containing UPF0001 family protein